MVHAADTREQARAELVAGWDRQRQADPDKTRIILTHTNAEVRELNQEARERVRASGELGEDVGVTVDRGGASSRPATGSCSCATIARLA
jgi:ATP-dependent exoDNAse (exonuclease V) alpha subunit